MHWPSITKSSRQDLEDKPSPAIPQAHIENIAECDQKNEIDTVQQTIVAIQSEEENSPPSPQNADAQVQPEDEIVYPHGLKLATITVAVAISVFLVALVCIL